MIKARLKPLDTFKSMIGAIIISIAALGIPLNAYPLSDAIIAVVNNHVITHKDLREYLAMAYFQLQSEGKSDAEIQERLSGYEADGVRRLIEDKLLLDEADAKGMTIRDKIIDEKVEEIKKRFASEQDFVKSIVAEGMTLTELRNRIRDQLKVKYLIDSEIKSKISVNPQEVTEYYQKNTELFKKPERVDLDSIFIPYGDDKENAQQKVSEVVDLLKNHINFRDAAKKFSKAPSLGIMAKGQMLPAIENVVFNLKVDEISKPVETDWGIYIFKLIAKYSAEQNPLEDTKENIYNTLFQQKFQARLTQWLEDLKRKAYIEIKN